VLKTILVWLGALIGAFVVGFAIFVAARQHLTFDVPLPPIAASTDTAVLARGRYLTAHLVHCSGCHGDPAKRAEAAAGKDVPLSGGYMWDIPPGKIYARNITSDSATGIGAASDGAIARALRYGVGIDGRALLPFMEFQGLSDEDLVAIVSYLRTQAPVRNAVPMHHYTLLGKVVKATVLANPVGPTETPLRMSPRGATVENGRYLVEFVSNCWACHTQRDMKTGALVGPRFGGATGFEAGPEGSWSPPNITSDPETGRLGHMSEDDFVTRFRAGSLLPHSPMPWQGFKNLAEDDLRAIYQYLKTVPPVHNDVGPPIVPGKK